MPKLRSEAIDEDLKKTYSTLILAFLFGWGAVFVRGVMTGFTSAKPGTSMITSLLTAIGFGGFLWSLAWLAAGFLFGFLFGVPKVVAEAPTPATPAPVPAMPDPVPAMLDPGPVVPVAAINHTRRTPSLRVNTNLEEISDWLTKVLVGASLTQVMKIPSAIYRCALFMSSYEPANGAASFNAAVLVYYSVLGFLAGYILTRMFFARVFALADEQ